MMPLLALVGLTAATMAVVATTRTARAPRALPSCPPRPAPAEAPDEFIGIAVRSGHDWVAGAEIDALLRHHGIESFEEGSLGYGISVRRRDALRAQALIRRDAQALGYHVHINRDACGREPPTAWTTVNVGARYRRTLLRSHIGPRTVLRDLLTDPETVETTGRLRRVLDLRLRPRLYHDDHWRSRIGYDVVLHVIGARGEGCGTEWWLDFQWLRPGEMYPLGCHGVEDPTAYRGRLTVHSRKRR
jgi:hypothetical protein